MWRRCEAASMANSSSLSPDDNGSLWLSGGITADPTLAPGLLFQSASLTTSNGHHYPQARNALSAGYVFKTAFVVWVFLSFPTFFPEQEIHLNCIGRGPIVYVYPTEINFGSIPVLKDHSKTVCLANQSDIPASFQAKVVSVCGAVFQGRVLATCSP